MIFPKYTLINLLKIIKIILFLFSIKINCVLYQNVCCGYYMPGTRWNMGIDPWTDQPEAGNIGWGNNIAAFFLTCQTCNRSG